MNADILIATILRHDRMVSSYKIALIRSLNDLSLGFAHLVESGMSIAIPIRTLASFWIAYYWPFTSHTNPILQGIPQANKQDISFRLSLTNLRKSWEKVIGSNSLASDGFYLTSEFQSPHRRDNYPPELVKAYFQTVHSISNAIKQPIRYAGPGEYSVFNPPQTWERIKLNQQHIVCIPGTQSNEQCLVVDAELWESFTKLSLWIEALCIHQWSLLTENISGVNRGSVYTLITDRPGNRRPLTWERNQVEILMMEGNVFECPWTGHTLNTKNYDLDHLLPLSAYPINELWNLVPADIDFNRNKKRDRLPNPYTLQIAKPRISSAYQNYINSQALEPILKHDAFLRFNGKVEPDDLPRSLANCAIRFIEMVAGSRNLTTF